MLLECLLMVDCHWWSSTACVSFWWRWGEFRCVNRVLWLGFRVWPKPYVQSFRLPGRCFGVQRSVHAYISTIQFTFPVVRALQGSPQIMTVFPVIVCWLPWWVLKTRIVSWLVDWIEHVLWQLQKGLHTYTWRRLVLTVSCWNKSDDNTLSSAITCMWLQVEIPLVYVYVETTIVAYRWSKK